MGVWSAHEDWYLVFLWWFRMAYTDLHWWFVGLIDSDIMWSHKMKQLPSRLVSHIVASIPTWKVWAAKVYNSVCCMVPFHWLLIHLWSQNVALTLIPHAQSSLMLSKQTNASWSQEERWHPNNGLLCLHSSVFLATRNGIIPFHRFQRSAPSFSSWAVRSLMALSTIPGWGGSSGDRKSLLRLRNGCCMAAWSTQLCHNVHYRHARLLCNRIELLLLTLDYTLLSLFTWIHSVQSSFISDVEDLPKVPAVCHHPSHLRCEAGRMLWRLKCLSPVDSLVTNERNVHDPRWPEGNPGRFSLI